MITKYHKQIYMLMYVTLSSLEHCSSEFTTKIVACENAIRKVNIGTSRKPTVKLWSIEIWLNGAVFDIHNAIINWTDFHISTHNQEMYIQTLSYLAHIAHSGVGETDQLSSRNRSSWLGCLLLQLLSVTTIIILHAFRWSSMYVILSEIYKRDKQLR